MIERRRESFAKAFRRERGEIAKQEGIATYCALMRDKYERTASRPWLTVEADPPAPYRKVYPRRRYKLIVTHYPFVVVEDWSDGTISYHFDMTIP